MHAGHDTAVPDEDEDDAADDDPADDEDEDAAAALLPDAEAPDDDDAEDDEDDVAEAEDDDDDGLLPLRCRQPPMASANPTSVMPRFTGASSVCRCLHPRPPGERMSTCAHAWGRP